MRINANGEGLIKKYEGCRLTAYRDTGGILTIGWGHTTAAGAPAVTSGMTITQVEADAIFSRDIARYEDAVTRVVKVDLTDDQFSALVSLCYNIGTGAFARSGVVAALNAGDARGATRRWALYTHDGHGNKLAGLVRRRADEIALFLSDTADIPTPRYANQAPGKHPAKSTTNAATVATATAGVACAAAPQQFSLEQVATLSGHARTIWENIGAMAPFAAVAVIAAGAGWIVFERVMKARHDGV